MLITGDLLGSKGYNLFVIGACCSNNAKHNLCVILLLIKTNDGKVTIK